MTSAAALVRWAAGVLLALYTVIVARLTLRPASAEKRTFDLLDRVVTRVSDGRLEWSATEVLANIALFVPAGFLLAIVVGRVWLAIGLCILASACIELAQHRYLPSRVPTIDDVRHNGLGGAIGAVLAWPAVVALRRSAVRRAHRPRPGSSANDEAGEDHPALALPRSHRY